MIDREICKQCCLSKGLKYAGVVKDHKTWLCPVTYKFVNAFRNIPAKCAKRFEQSISTAAADIVKKV